MEMIWLILKKLSYSAFLICLFMACFDLGSSYQKHYAENGDTFNDWLNFEKEYTYEEIHRMEFDDNPLEYTYQERTKDYQFVVSRVKLSLVFIFLVTIFDYFLNKEEHWLTKIKGLGNKIKIAEE